MSILKIKKRKGELTTQQIVGLIVLIASFSVLVYFIFNLGLGEETDKQLCRNSVVQRGVNPVSVESIPLQCRTSYVCISEDGSCEKLTNPVIERVETQEEVYHVLAEEMASCWSMFGEGKINYIGKELVPKLYCSICSQIAFDDSLEKDIFSEGKFDQRGFYNFLENNQFKENMNYLEYLQGKLNLDEFHKNNFSEIDLKKQYYVLMGINSDVSKLGWTLAGAGSVATIGVGIVASPLVGVSGALALTIGGIGGAVVGGSGGYYVGTVLEGESGLDYLHPTLVEVNSKTFKALDCGEIVTLA